MKNYFEIGFIDFEDFSEKNFNDNNYVCYNSNGLKYPNQTK